MDELKESYILKNDLQKMEIIKQLQIKLEREIVSTESLYLRL